MTIQTKKAKETLPVFVVNSQILQSFKKISREQSRDKLTINIPPRSKNITVCSAVPGSLIFTCCGKFCGKFSCHHMPLNAVKCHSCIAALTALLLEPLRLIAQKCPQRLTLIYFFCLNKQRGLRVFFQ